MNSLNLQGKTLAILATDGFEQSELFEPMKQLAEMGAQVDIVSLQSGEIRGWNETDWGEPVKVDKVLDEAQPSDYDALVLPGGLFNPDKLRNTPAAVNFIKQFYSETGEAPIAAICHGPWLLVESKLVNNVTMTSYPSIKTDLSNAGARWIDEEVVTDGRIITSRKPDDLPVFINTIARYLH